METKKVLVFVVTFLVSFCSIIYELVYSQLLTVIFGGTVLRYSITIGLFLFCLGIGSFLYNYLEKYDKKKSFVLVELGLSLVGFFGAVFIIGLNSYFSFLPHLVRVILSNLPVVLIGILSGLDLPLLSYFAGEKSSEYSKVLGVDYFGSLAGTFIYSLILYPYQGLIFTAAVVAFTNLIVALLLFIFLYKKRSLIFTIVFVVFVSAFILLLFNMSTVSDYLMKMYLEKSVIASYGDWLMRGISVNITDLFYTPYQMVFLYSVMLDYGGTNTLLNNCMNIDEHVQLCDSWVNEYHAGLVDVPVAFLRNVSSDTKVLLVGGGDGIAVNYLSKYNVSIDQVDIDEKFVEYGKNSSFVLKYQNNSFDYTLLNLTIDDGFSYLRETNKKYDFIILDLPGLKSDKLLSLYSKEFFISLNKALSDGGLVVMWAYSSDNEKHRAILLNTLASAGFNYYLPYASYHLPGNSIDLVEDYLLISNHNNLTINLNSSQYVSSLTTRYSNLSWYELNYTNSIRVNSVFRPSYDMIISNEK